MIQHHNNNVNSWKKIMMKNNGSSRRDFLKMSAMASGALAALTPYSSLATSRGLVKSSDKLPGEIWVAAFSLTDLQAKTPELFAQKVLDKLNENVPYYNPDIVCLPEYFLFSANVAEKKMPWEKKLKISSEALDQFSNYAKQRHCYIICPLFVEENDKIYDSAVLFDRNGTRLGDYKKIHLTKGEIEDGMTPGPVAPPVFQTEFGKIGFQICYDIMWEDGWKKLREKGAEIVFWPSAYSAGRNVNAKAWQNRYPVVSSSWKDTSKICDLTGDAVAETGRWQRNFICAPLNLEKAVLHTWPSFKKFKDIEKKYGRKIQITTFHEEESSIIESLSPDVFVADILKEFDLKTYNERLRMDEEAQMAARRK